MAAGMLEGFLTGELIYKNYRNIYAGYCDSDPDICVKFKRFSGKNLKWISTQIANNPNDKYWYQVSYVTKTEIKKKTVESLIGSLVPYVGNNTGNMTNKLVDLLQGRTSPHSTR